MSTLSAKSSFTLPDKCRIKKRKEFIALQARGNKTYSKLFLVAWQLRPKEQTEDLPSLTSRIGITVSRKIDKRATVRNRIKRLIRESFRLNRHRIAFPVDLVIIVRPDAIGKTFQDVQREFLRALEKAKLLLEKNA